MTDKMTAEITVTNISLKGSGFAVTPDGETVFINRQMVERIGIDFGDVLVAHLVPNSKNCEKIPYKAAHVRKVEPNAMSPDDVHLALSSFDYPVTAQEAECPLSSLIAAHELGRVVKVMVYKRPDVSPVLMWAADMEVV